MDHQYLQCNPTTALHALLAHIQVCMPGRIAIASLIGATRAFVIELIAIPLLFPGLLHACMIKSGLKKANIGVFKTIYGPVRLSSTCISGYTSITGNNKLSCGPARIVC